MRKAIAYVAGIVFLVAPAIVAAATHPVVLAVVSHHP
jgi:hypothetical protein